MNAVPRRESFGTRLFNRFVPGAAPSPEIGRTVPQIKSRPSAGFFHNEMSPFLAGWNPRLREQCILSSFGTDNALEAAMFFSEEAAAKRAKDDLCDLPLKVVG